MTSGAALLQRSLLTFGAQVATALCSILANFLVARSLGPEGKGQTYLVYLASGLTVIILLGGIDQAMIYYVGRQLYRREVVLATSTAYAAFTGALGVTIFFLTPPHWRDALLRGLPRTLQWIALASVPIYLLICTWTFFVLALNHVPLYNFLKSLPYLSYTVMLVPALIFMPHRVTVVATVWLGGAVVTLIACLILVNRQVKLRPTVSWGFARHGIAFGLKTQLGGVLQLFNYRLDAFILNYWWGGSQVGIYSVSVALAELLWYLPLSASTVLGPEVSRRDPAAASQATSWACRNVFWLAVAGGLALFVVSRVLIRIFLPAFLTAIPTLAILLPGVSATCFTRVIASDLNSRGKPLLPSSVAFASACLALALCFGMIPRFGMWGAAAATSISYGFSALLSLVVFAAVTKVKMRDLLVPRASNVRRYAELWVGLRSRILGGRQA